MRGLLTDEEWSFFEPFVMATNGRPPSDHRRTLDGVFWIARTGAPWRDLPDALGNSNSVHKQFRRWTTGGLWDLMLEALARGRRQRLGADGRQHRDTSPPLCGRRKRGTQNQALGRSRGGFSTKIHARTNAEGLPIALLLTPGEAHDSTALQRPDGRARRRSRGHARRHAATTATPSATRFAPEEARRRSRPRRTDGSSTPSTGRCMPPETASSGSSTASRTAGVWPPATTIPPAASSASPSLASIKQWISFVHAT